MLPPRTPPPAFPCLCCSFCTTIAPTTARTDAVVGDTSMRKDILQRLSEVNRELWLILSLFIIAGILNNLVAQHGFILNLYALPTIFSAYVYGRRHAVLTALASICIVVILTYVNPAVLASRNLV